MGLKVDLVSEGKEILPISMALPKECCYECERYDKDNNKLRNKLYCMVGCEKWPNAMSKEMMDASERQRSCYSCKYFSRDILGDPKCAACYVLTETHASCDRYKKKEVF